MLLFNSHNCQQSLVLCSTGSTHSQLSAEHRAFQHWCFSELTNVSRTPCFSAVLFSTHKCQQNLMLFSTGAFQHSQLPAEHCAFHHWCFSALTTARRTLCFSALVFLSFANAIITSLGVFCFVKIRSQKCQYKNDASDPCSQVPYWIFNPTHIEKVMNNHRHQPATSPNTMVFAH